MNIDRIQGLPKTTDQNAREINLRCPHCRREGVFYSIHQVSDITWAVIETSPGGSTKMTAQPTIGIRICPNGGCRAFVFVVIDRGKLVRSFPPEVIDFDASNLPERITATLEEAVKCHAAGCYRAAALMIRRALEEVCDDKKATGGNLKQRIAALGATIIIPPDLLEAADELRLLGNDAAHIEAQLYDAIEEEEVATALDLTKELLKAVYQYNSLVARLRALKKP